MSNELLLDTTEIFWEFYEATQTAEAKSERTGGQTSWTTDELSGVGARKTTSSQTITANKSL